MMGNVLELRTINELNQYSFFIPSYQRGYKWSKKEVSDLLRDINDFNSKLVDESTGEKTWYCLQPIVVKEKYNNCFEVIDGQQRLTTVFLIQHFLNQDFVEKRRDTLFNLDYETRSNTKSFFSKIDDENGNNENIDFFYISEAYKTIKDWFETQEINFDSGDFRSKLKFNSKVIWYEIREDDPISIFTRINIGKIPLTNSELIKALFLNSANFNKNEKQLKLKQLEIATEWDIIEHSLQNDRFWYFLTGNQKTTNRIEFIFDLMNEKDDISDNYSTFRYFSSKFKVKDKITIEQNWKDVKDRYQRFREWFDERDLFHKIGYLVYIEEVSIRQLYDASYKLTKSGFRNYLDNLIKKSLKNVCLDELQYDDKKNVKKVLLLYNILTMLSSEKDNSYFPFELFKNEKWDIEHITSVKDSIPDKNRKDWLTDAKTFIDIEKREGQLLLKRAEEIDTANDDEFKNLFKEIVSHFNSKIKDEDMNHVSNLALLDSKTNRGYKNAVFPLKRKTIINRDKAGTFIPICTKNVFLKYFSEYPPKISFWTQDDREKYEEDLHKVLGKYLNN